MALVQCKDCENFYTDSKTACPKCGSEYVVAEKKVEIKRERTFSGNSLDANRRNQEATSNSSIELKTLHAIRSIAIFLLFSFQAGLAFMWAAYSDMTWDSEYYSNPMGWFPWTLAWILFLVGVFGSLISLRLSNPKR
jgi:hypothetical protein